MVNSIIWRPEDIIETDEEVVGNRVRSVAAMPSTVKLLVGYLSRTRPVKESTKTKAPETKRNITYAMMFTSFPLAFLAILSASLSALASIEPEGGTAATITSMPLADKASVMPRQ